MNYTHAHHGVWSVRERLSPQRVSYRRCHTAVEISMSMSTSITLSGEYRRSYTICLMMIGTADMVIY